MKKVFFLLVVLIAVLSVSPVFPSPSQIHLIAPDEESFIGTQQILVIGNVPASVEADQVEVSDNGKTIGSAAVREGTFVFRYRLSEGLHDIVFSMPAVETKTVKVFVGKQEGYRYHMETDIDSCGDCHAEASSHRYRIESMQTEICSKCHGPVGVKEYVHGPVAAGSCIPCHDPHGSRHQDFLTAVGKDLCLRCHDQNLSRKHVEERQNAQCIKCHDPHSSSNNYHLR